MNVDLEANKLNTIFAENQQEKGAFSSPNRNFLFLDYDKLAKINEKKAKCGLNFKDYVKIETMEIVEFPIYCDNRSCVKCKDHKLYKFQKEHNVQISALNKSMRDPKAWVWTGYVLPYSELTREFCVQLLLKAFYLLKRYSRTEFSVHMELKLYENDTVYLHFHIVSAYIDNIRLVQKLWTRVIRNEEAKVMDNVGRYVSKYASKVPIFYNQNQEDWYTLFVYKLQMNRFSPKSAIGQVNNVYDKEQSFKDWFVVPNLRDVYERNERIKLRELNKIKEAEKPPPNYYLVDNLEREVYTALKRDEFNKNGSRNNYHPFIVSYEEKHKVSVLKKVTLESFDNG